MVGFFPGFKMPFHAVNTIASRVWRPYGLENVMTTTNGFMLFRFKTEEELHAVLEKGPWMFGGKNIILQQWHPRFKFDKSKISTLPVWIRLHGLPFPLWSKQGLSLAASMVGRPLSCDELTYSCTRLEYARLCVELDAALPFIHSFDIDCPLSAEPITVTVEYEWKPSRCGKCNIFGHSCPTPSIPNPPPSTTTKDTPTLPIPTPITLPPIPDMNDQPPYDQCPLPLDQPPNIVTLHKATIPPTAPTPHIQPTLPLPITANIPQTTPTPHPPPMKPLSSPLPLPSPSPPHITDPNPMHLPHVLEDDSEFSQAADNDFSAFNQHHLTTNACVESKMDSLRTLSDTSSTAVEILGDNSPTSTPRTVTQSPSPSPKTVRKKKGGRKRKEAKGH
jgi:hypothetical protein